MSNIVEADYTVVQERTLPVIIGEIKIIEQNVAKTAMEGAVQIGQRLQEAKEQVGHGNFDTWCQENLNYSRRTAENFMRISREYGGGNGLLAKAKISSHFSISNALSLLKVPEEDREKFVEEHPVEDMTNKALEDEIRKLKEEKEKNEEDMDSLRRMAKAAEEETNQALHEIEDLKRQLQEAESSANQEEVAKLEDRLQIAQKEANAAGVKADELQIKLDKAKEKLKKEKANRQAEIDAAIEKERQDIINQVNAEAADRMEKITGENETLRQQLDETAKKLERVSQGTILQFKVMTDQLQDTFAKCGELILEEPDQEMADKMNGALKAIVQAFEGAL